MSRSKKGGLYGRRKRALARLEVALAATPKEEVKRIDRINAEITVLKERLLTKIN